MIPVGWNNREVAGEPTTTLHSNGGRFMIAVCADQFQLIDAGTVREQGGCYLHETVALAVQHAERLVGDSHRAFLAAQREAR